MNAAHRKSLAMSSILVALAMGTQGCYVYSAFQGARTLDEGRSSISPSLSFINSRSEGESNWATTQFGARGAIGVGNRLEIQSRYERVAPQYDGGPDDWGYNYLDIGFKYGIVEDRVAFGMPVGFMFGENVDESESWQIHPSLYLTLPATPYLDVNLSTKGIVFLNDQAEDFLLAFNGGLGVRPAVGNFTLMPELGMLVSPGESGMYWHWGLGASMEF